MAKELSVSLNNMRATVNQMIKKGYVSKFDPKEIMDKYVAFVELRKSKRPDPQVLIELHKQGFSKKEIIEKLEIGERFASDTLNGMAKQKSSLFKTKLIEMYEAGIPLKEMAEKLNCSESKVGVSVHRLVKQGKLKSRKQFRHRPAIAKLLENNVTTTKLLKTNEAAKQLGVAVNTLLRWEANGLIAPNKLPSGHRRYNLEEIKQQLEVTNGHL